MTFEKFICRVFGHRWVVGNDGDGTYRRCWCGLREVVERKVCDS